MPNSNSSVEKQSRHLHPPLASGNWRAALLRVRAGPECPEGNLRELT